MTTVDINTPQAQAAADFMAYKGLDVRPNSVEKLEGSVPCWYFYYTLPEGQLELEVFYDDHLKDWECTVTAFPLAV